MKPSRSRLLYLAIIATAVPVTAQTRVRTAPGTASRSVPLEMIWDAQNYVRDCEQELSDAQREQNDLKTRAQRYPDRVQDLRRKQQNLQTMAKQAREDLPKAKEDIDKAQAKLNAATQPADEARKRLDAAKAEADKVRTAAVAEFEQGDAYKAAKQAVEAAKSKLTAATESRLAALERDPKFKADKAVMESNEQAVRQMRASSNPDRAQLATASRAWIESKGRVESARKQAVERDPAITKARTDLASAEKAAADLKSQFEKSLPTRPDVAAALANVAAEQKRYDAAAGVVAMAEKELASAKKRQTDDEKTIKESAEDVKKADDQIAQLQKEQDALTPQVAAADKKVKAAQEAVTRAKWELDRVQGLYVGGTQFQQQRDASVRGRQGR